MTIEEIYHQKCNDNSDICEHLPTLRRYAEKCDSVIELGVRSVVSTWAFLAAKPKIILSIDIKHPSEYADYDPNGCNLELVEELAWRNEISFGFIQADTLQVELPEADLIFFDTLHTYDQLSKELELHGHKARKYLIFHDTETYKDELLPAIDQYVTFSSEWAYRERAYNNNGLIVVQRKKYRKMTERNDLVQWQRYSPSNGLVQAWWVHPFLDLMESWDWSEKTMLELGAGLGTAWLRSKCKWVDSIDASPAWALKAQQYCEDNNRLNGRIFAQELPDGVQERKQEFFDLFPNNTQYDIISVDSIWRYECLKWALEHFKGRGGMLIFDNWEQSYVNISPPSVELMKQYKINIFEQADHTDNDGVNKWKTVYWVID
jgi:hypothetical protein